MNTVKNIIAISIICMMALGCKESFLDLAPESSSNANNFYKTKQDFDIAVNAAYSTLYVMFGPESHNSFCGELLTDNCTMYSSSAFGTVSASDRLAYKDYNVQPSNTANYFHWRTCYISLYNVNIVLEKIEGANVDADYKAGVKAQMMFLRALYYFTMVQVWGDLPLVTKPISDFDLSYNTLRSPVADVYAQIIADLEYAIPILPAANAVTAAGRVSKQAAQTLLGKVYLTMGNKTSASNVLMEVYNSHLFEIASVPYANLWSITTKNTKESIFEIQFIGGSATSPYSTYNDDFAPRENGGSLTFGGGMNQVTDNLYNEYEANDIRRDLSINFGYGVRYPKKWDDLTVTASLCYSHNNFIVLRYADVLLMLTEATGNASYLNEVRHRVGLPGYGEVGYPSSTYPTLEDALIHERRVELALEFHRWFDLKRFGKATTVISAAKGKTITNNMLLMPIPITVITQNPKITQNPGY